MNKNTDNEIIEILAKRFVLTFEQAKTLSIAHRLTGSCEEGVEATANLYNLSPEIVRAVFYSLDDLYQIIKEEKDLKKWWETGEM
ncbi:MAG: hypothetical protein V1709_11605 [Planctomycetota bacterium]